MRRVWGIGILFFVLSFNCFGVDKKYINLNIQGLTCPYCVSMLVKKVGSLQGVEEVRVSTDSKRLLIIMEPNQNPNMEQISNTISQAGYLVISSQESLEKNVGNNKNTTLSKNIHMEVKNQPCNSCHKK